MSLNVPRSDINGGLKISSSNSSVPEGIEFKFVGNILHIFKVKDGEVSAAEIIMDELPAGAPQG